MSIPPRPEPSPPSPITAGPLAFATFWMVVLTALGVRLAGLDRESLFMDEILQASFYDFRLADLVSLAAIQSQPPLDYGIGWGVVRLFGNTDFVVRLPAALFGTAAVGLLMGILRRFATWPVVLGIGLIYALSPFAVYYSQEARPYAATACLFLLWLWATLRRIEPSEAAKPGGPTYLFIALCFLFVSALTPAITLASAIGLLLVGTAAVSRTRHAPLARRWLTTALLNLAALALYLPMLAYLLTGSRRYTPEASVTRLDWLAQGIARLDLRPLWEALLTQAEPLGWVVAFAVILAPLTLLKSTGRHPAWVFLLALTFGLPLAHLAVFQAATSLPFRPPYPTYLLPLGLLIVGGGLASAIGATPVRMRRHATWAISALLVSALILFGMRLLESRSLERRADWEGMAHILAESAGTGRIAFIHSFQSPLGWGPSRHPFDRYPSHPTRVRDITELWRAPPTMLDLKGPRPALLFFHWYPYYLTPHSPAPVVPLPEGTADTRPLANRLATDPRLTVRSVLGLTLVESASPGAGTVAEEALRLLDAVIPALPADDTSAAPLFARYRLALYLGHPRTGEWQRELLAHTSDAARARLEAQARKP